MQILLGVAFRKATKAVKVKSSGSSSYRLFSSVQHSTCHSTCPCCFDPLPSRRETAQATFAYRLLHQSLLSHLQSFLDSHVLPKSAKSLSLQNRQSIRLPRAHKSLLSSSPLDVCSSSWNSLPSSVQQSSSLSVFKSSLATL